MPYFQNLFSSEVIAPILLSDRQFNVTFKLRANPNSSTNMVNWKDGPYNTVGNTKFKINYSHDYGRNFGSISVTLTSGSAVTASTIVADLNADTSFNKVFTAEVAGNRIRIKSSINNVKFKAYIPNIADSADPTNTAEQILLFNLKADVIEMPSYFDRHTIANYNTFDDSMGALHKLTQTDENFVITNAGLSTTPKADYELLEGKSSLFMFYKQTVDSSSRITQIIEYPAGAKAGDLAKKTTYSYTGAKTAPDVYAEVPYVLTGSDLVSPP